MPSPLQPLLSANQTFLIWMMLAGLVLASWIAAIVTIGPGPGSRPRRAAIAVGSAIAFSLGALLLARVAIAAKGWPAPLDLLRSIPRLSSQLPPGDGVLLLALAQALPLPLWSALAGLIHRGFKDARPFRVPFRLGLAIALTCLVASAAIFMAHARGGDDPVLADLLGLLCVAGLQLIVWSAAERVPPPAPEKQEDAPAPELVATTDVPAIWFRIGAANRAEGPLFSEPARKGVLRHDWPQYAWYQAGMLGAPPAALGQLSERWSHPGHGWLVGDMPDETERALVVASSLVAAYRNGLRVLVITPGLGTDGVGQAERLRDEVKAAFERVGWHPGPLVAGAAELQSTASRSRLPTVVFLDIGTLSSEAIRKISQDPKVGAWAASVGLVIASRIDQGAPLEVTHRMFALRRLTLAMRAAGARWSVLGTGFANSGSRTLLHKAFPSLRNVDEVPLDLPSSAKVRGWIALQDFKNSTQTTPWVRNALDEVSQRGEKVAVGDPEGAFGRDVRPWNRSVDLVRYVTYGGRASACDLSEAWLIASYRARKSVTPRENNQPHDALWSVPVSPVGLFLARDGHLPSFDQQGLLPSPRPLVGDDNRLVAEAHLRASLAEGNQDFASLRAIFGESAVDALLRTQRTNRWVLRALPSSETLVRTELAPVPSDAVADDVLKSTVTPNIMRIRNANSGEDLQLRVDMPLAATRYYPRRVFAHGEKRYRVKEETHDEKRRELLVVEAPDAPLTKPILDISIAQGTVQSRGRMERRVGGIRYTVVNLRFVVLEAVRGYRTSGPNPAATIYGAPATAEYPTSGKGIYFDLPADQAPSANTLQHFASSLDGVLLATLLAGDEDVEVIPDANQYAGLGYGVIAVDRSVMGMGVTGALEDEIIEKGLEWVKAILNECPCSDGCPKCTPLQALELGPDKDGVLRLLS